MGAGPPENHTNIGLPCNTGSDPLKNHKATKPAFNVWPSSAASFARGLMMAHLKQYLIPVSPHQL